MSNITCPKCHTTYTLPNQAKNGSKLRCSVCQTVFMLADNEGPEEKLEMPESQGRSIVRILPAAVLVFVLIGCGYLWFGTHHLDVFKSFIEQRTASIFKQDNAGKKAEEDKWTVYSPRQYSLANENAGSLVVIEGKIVNTNADNRAKILLQAKLFDDKDTVVASREQLAGTWVSLSQLQVLERDEISKLLSDPNDIMENNSNVLPGQHVQFMFVFFDPPESAVRYEIKVINAEKP